MGNMPCNCSAASVVEAEIWVVWKACALLLLLLDHTLQTIDALSSDGHALLAFKRDPYISSHKGMWETWNESDTNPCGWVGVTCNADFGVERLDFSSWSLGGYLYMDGLPSAPTSLCKLTSLRELDMSSNHLAIITSGLICVGWHELTLLDFSGNYKPTILDWIAQMHSLRYLNLDSCSISGSWSGHEWDSLVNLQVLSLSGNDFSGKIPWLGNLTRLQILDLSHNSFNGSIPNLEGLTSLVSVSLTNNSLSGKIPKVEALTRLVTLDISYNNLTGDIPLLGALLHLQYLYLQENRLTGFTNGTRFQAGPSLMVVDISGNRLEGTIPDAIARLPNLTYLRLSSNSLGGQMPSGFQNVQTLDLSFNLLWGQIPSVLGHVHYLDLSSNQLSGHIPQDIGSNGSNGSNVTDGLDYYLFFRDLSGNHLIGTIPPLLLWPVIHGDTVVTYVNLSRNSLTGNIPDPSFDLGGSALTLAPIVGAIDLSDNQLDGTVPAFFASNISVELLYLQNNQLLGDINDVISNWYIGEARLQGNRFTGDITRLLEDKGQFLATVAVLDLSYNHLSMTPTSNYLDPLQAMLERSLSLVELRLAGNDLSGIRLPHTLNMSMDNALQVLDLSHTNLEGDISSELFIPLFNLSFFDVSNNRLSGRIPSSLPRILSDPRFFMYNPGLCGWPLPDCPRPRPRQSLNVGVLWGVILAAGFVSMASCLVIVWQWRVYSKKHQQDRDLIETLMERQVTVGVMPLRELRKATHNFSVDHQIGVGGFGTVYIGQLEDGTTVAIKKSKREGTLQDKQQFLNEVRILSQVNHRSLVQLLGCCMENKVALLVFEYVPNGTLQEHLQGKTGLEGGSRLTWRNRLQIAVQTSDALTYLHSAANPPIFHRDVKSANILLDQHLNAKVADFGISKLAPMGATHVSTVAMGTIGYMDPEYYTTFQLTSKSDVHGFGVVLLELISAKSPVDFLRGREEVSLVNMALSVINKGEWPQLVDPVLMKTFESPSGRASMETVAHLAISCLAMRSRDRPEMKQVCQQLQILWLQCDASSDHALSNLPEEMSQGGEDNPAHDFISILTSDYCQISHTLSTSSSSGHIQMQDLVLPFVRQ